MRCWTVELWRMWLKWKCWNEWILIYDLNDLERDWLEQTRNPLRWEEQHLFQWESVKRKRSWDVLQLKTWEWNWLLDSHGYKTWDWARILKQICEMGRYLTEKRDIEVNINNNHTEKQESNQWRQSVTVTRLSALETDFQWDSNPDCTREDTSTWFELRTKAAELLAYDASADCPWRQYPTDEAWEWAFLSDSLYEWHSNPVYKTYYQDMHYLSAMLNFNILIIMKNAKFPFIQE